VIVVPIRPDNDPIHGLGVPVRESIRKGACGREFNPLFDLRFTEEGFERLPPSVRAETGVHRCQAGHRGLLYY
jgi:hypothetical protein